MQILWPDPTSSLFLIFLVHSAYSCDFSLIFLILKFENVRKINSWDSGTHYHSRSIAHMSQLGTNIATTFYYTFFEKFKKSQWLATLPFTIFCKLEKISITSKK
jgi:hypothetical protein